jgi:hypothetical protein
LVSVVLVTTAAEAWAIPTKDCGVSGVVSGCSNTGDGAALGLLSAHQLTHLPEYDGDTSGGAPVDPAVVMRFAYDSTTACTMSPPGSAVADHLCAHAVTACMNPANGPGPLMRIWRQGTLNGQVVQPWTMIGVTCHANVAPNARPMLTMAMIQEAFNLTPWATGCTEVEPVGNVTLVGLDTFYRVEWSTEGFEPGEVHAVDPARMLGYRVDIRPKLVGLTYRFGDGSEFGPTPSLGGRYPSGPIRHQYPQTGTFPVSVAVTWGGDFRIDGGDWTPIPNTVTVGGPATQLEVKAARAVLVQR